MDAPTDWIVVGGAGWAFGNGHHLTAPPRRDDQGSGALTNSGKGSRNIEHLSRVWEPAGAGRGWTHRLRESADSFSLGARWCRPWVD